jgi:sigma-B regulation protein RsbU (phosphoserine phosphatase)
MAEISSRREIAYRCLIDAARSLSSAADVDELVGHILSSSREVMQCRACSVYLPEPATDSLLIRATQEELRNIVLRVPAGKGIAGRVFRTRRAENTPDVQSDSDHYSAIGIETKTPAQAMLTIPLEDGDVCHGVMQALNPTDRASFDEFDEEVFFAFGSLISATLTRMRAQEEAKEKEIEEVYRNAELSIARNAQFSFMPPARFATQDLSIRVFQEQAADIGGDFYAYHELADGCLLAAVGDASGKGIPAALESARVCTLISLKAKSCTADRVSDWLMDLNNVLHETAERAASLTTLAILVFDRKRRRVRACTFGQARPRYLSSANQWEELSCEVHPPLGLLATQSFSATSVPLALGSQWLLLTDGFIEARSRLGTQFGEKALEESLSESARDRADPLTVLERRWREFSKDGPEADDATAMLVADTSPHPVNSFECEITPVSISQLRSFCEQWVQFVGFVEAESYNIVLACDEIFTNLHKHAYRGQPGPVRCDASADQDFLTFVVTHQGVGLSSDPALPRPPKPSESGGYGLPFIHRIFDDVKFETTGQGSKVTLVKSIRIPDL